VRVIDAQHDANAPVWIRVFNDGAVLGSSNSQRRGLWLTLEEDMVCSRTPIGVFLPTLGVYPRLKRIGITSGSGGEL
jgi:hypothetical protein